MRRTVLPIEHIHAWARLNGITFYNVSIERNIATPFGQEEIDKGAGLMAIEDFPQDNGDEILITVPPDLILTKEQVWRQAALDRNMKRILDETGDFGKTSRGAILIFLLLQITQSSLESGEQILIHSAFTDYVKLLPETVLLPTLWTPEEKELLIGTTLWDALNQKMESLEREYILLYDSTRNNPWAQRYWWDRDTGRLGFRDWLVVDALYRSRALELPVIGHAMVPCIDMPNHASVQYQNATYEEESNGSVTLDRIGRPLRRGEEVTINYGEEKGACEMLFSYGFVPRDMTHATEMFLPIDIPDDDPLRLPKMHVNRFAPRGIKVCLNETRETALNGHYIWWSCVNEEDGLDFNTVRDTNGERQLEVLWHGQLIEPIELQNRIQADPRAPIFRLRMIVLLMERIEMQLEPMQTVDEFLESKEQEGVRSSVWEHISNLRSLEISFFSSLHKAVAELKAELLEDDIVKEYLRTAQAETNFQDAFGQ